VHHAVLKDGTEVAVKVRRPGIERELEQDVYILTGIAHLLEKHIQDSRIYNPTGVVEEFARTVRQEINFEIELDNAVKFADIFRGSDTIKIPEVFTVYSSRRVMTMERISGIRINELDRLDAAGFDRTVLAMNGAHAFFKQIFENGFFHADPHAGNMFVLEDGRVGLLDFGMVGRLSEENMEVIADTFLALVNRDFDGLVQQYINLGFVSEDTDLDKFRKEFKRDLVDLIDPLYGKAFGKIRVGDYLNRVTEIAGRHGMRFPKELVLVNKALFTIEGIGRQLDPEMDFLEVAKPYSASLVKKKLSPSRYLKKARKNLEELSSFTESLPRHLRVIIGKIKRDDIKVNIEVTHLERFIRDFDRSTNRLSFALIISGITISSSVIIHARMGRIVFGYPVLGLIGYIMAGILGLWLVWGIIRSGRL
jgi:ubiquinone biosynthesis protein